MAESNIAATGRSQRAATTFRKPLYRKFWALFFIAVILMAVVGMLLSSVGRLPFMGPPTPAEIASEKEHRGLLWIAVVILFGAAGCVIASTEVLRHFRESPQLRALLEVRLLIARPANTFADSPWKNAQEALVAVDALLDDFGSRSWPDPTQFEAIFRPDGDWYRLGERNGWAQDFVQLGERIKGAMVS